MGFVQRWSNDKKEEMRQELKNQLDQQRQCEKNEQIPDDVPANIRLYQIKRDMCLEKNPPDLISSYMELVVQYGFIALFSVVFPLAPFLSLIANLI